MAGRATAVALLATATLVAGTVSAATAAPGDFRPGAAGAGDSYFPNAGNGGYDAQHYTLRLRYDPATDRLRGTAEMAAVTTQGLSRFDLDFQGMRVRSVKVDGRNAAWHRDGGELVVRPPAGLPEGTEFTVLTRYGGIPRTLPDGSGFIHTEDGALVVGQPKVAATWFPVNDHPSDKASYSFFVSAPDTRKVVANGELVGQDSADGWTTWHWEAAEPMASYLATASIGNWDMTSYSLGDIDVWDAIDPVLYTPVAEPRTGTQFAISQPDSPAYKRFGRTFTVPDEGGRLSFWVLRDTEEPWDPFFVEAHTVGGNDWTTLRDLRGHTSREAAPACQYPPDLHPFLRHYLNPDGCRPSGTTGQWHAASGGSDGYERWTVNLNRYAGQDVFVALTALTDPIIQLPGVFVDDVTGPGGQGTTSFEADGSPSDGWAPAPPPNGSDAPRDWTVGTVDDTPPSVGHVAADSFSRHGEILDFLAAQFGPYPFDQAGGVVDDVQGLGFALENQTRPIYAPDFFVDPIDPQAVDVVVHELAHQWYGDSLTVRRWRHIWLNEGFATYAEWLWSNAEGRESEQELFDGWYSAFPKGDPFWHVKIGDPGPAQLFEFAVYQRGAMTLHQLRRKVGDDVFFQILRTWFDHNRGGLVTTRRFIGLSERLSGLDLDRFFHRWLFTTHRPRVPGAQGQADAALTSLARDRRLSPDVLSARLQRAPRP